jgi:mRNA interferase MazF
VDLEPVRGHEQGGRRPCLVLSDDRFNRSPAELAIVLPITSIDKRIRLHVAVAPPDGGLRRRSFVKPEDIRSVSMQRLGRRLGVVSAETMETVEARVRTLLGL